jgi:tRNA-guanine family transglycosylase
LLDARELLGDMLLERHNVHHLQLFMRSVRESIAVGDFDSLCQGFCSDFS